MALTKITTSLVAVNTLTAANIADNTIDATKIAQNQILARHIAAGALSDQLAANSITAAMIPNATALTLDGGVTSGNTTISSNTISNPAASMILDSAGDIILDADGQDVIFKDGGTQFGSIRKNGNNIQLMASIEDGDITFHGDDGGSAITAMAIDMSAGGNVGIGTTSPAFSTGSGLEIERSGTATLRLQDSGNKSAEIRMGSDLEFVSINSGSNMVFDATGDIVLDADGGDINLKDGGTEFLRISNSSDGPQFYSPVSDKDFKFIVNFWNINFLNHY